jgi:uncharacterized FAD-dependent dehydrogenase
MNEQENQMQINERAIEDAREDVALADALQRLHENKDFKKIVLTDYFEKNAQRAVMMKSDPTQQSPEKQKDIDNVIVGIGQLGMYFHKIFVFGERSANGLRDDIQTQAEMIEEQAMVDASELVN